MFRRSLLIPTLLLSTFVLLARGATAAIGDGSRGSSMAAQTAPTPGVLTFQAWKNLRVDEARLVLERITYESQVERMPMIERTPGEKQAVVRSGTNARPAVKGGRPESRIESRVEQARMNLEIAQDLTVSDYLVIYLSQFKSREAMLDVAKRMPPEDVAELLMSHQKLTAGGQVAEHSPQPAPKLPPRPL